MSDLGSSPTSPKAVGVRLQLTREALGLAKGAFAASAGIAGNTYSQYENGKRVPELEFALRLCDRYELTLDWVYRGDPSGLKYNLAEKIIQARQARNTQKRK